MNTSLLSYKRFRGQTLTWSIWLLAVGFYFYDFLLRVFPSVMIEALMLSFNIDAETVGEISGSYFYIYALMQFPVGLLMDRYGARRLLTFASLSCGASVILFAVAPNTDVLLISRLIVAFGSAFAFVGMLYITSHWFPKRKMALLIGIGNSIGMLGGVFGEGPISIAETTFGWRISVVGLGVLGIILSLLIYLVVHRAPSSHESKKQVSGSFLEAWKQLKTVLRCSQAWLNSSISFFIYSTTTGFAALWGVFFLEHNHGLSRNLASFANSMIFIGWVIGGPIVGHISSMIGRKRPILQICSLTGGLLMLPVIFITHLPTSLIFFLMISVGICSSAQLLTFSHAIELFTHKATGSASAFTNFIVTIGGALYQPFVGWMLDLFWSGGYHNGIKVYSHADYTLSMLCFPLSFFIAFILAFFMKDKKLMTRV